MKRPPKYRFHLDENFPLSAGKFLASLGHNVSHTNTVKYRKLQGASDYVQLRFAIREQRIFVTYDRDFHQQHLARLIEQSLGVITVRGEATSALLKKIVRTITIESVKGKLCRASIDLVRITRPRL